VKIKLLLKLKMVLNLTMTEQNNNKETIESLKHAVQKLLSDFEEFSKKLNPEREEENGEC